MGSSKKHKDKEKEHKRKKKHRSRSRSRERKHKKEKREDKYDKRVKRERDDDDEHYYEEGEIPGLDLVSVKKEEPHADYGEYSGGIAEADEEAGGGGGGDLSLSIEETNRLRAKLGLKPLDVGGAKTEESSDAAEPVKKEDVHVPAANLTQLKKTEKLREKMEQIREKRKINQKLGKVKALGESDEEDEGALAWINKSRKLQRDKEEAEKRAKMLDDMDEEFGISGLIDEEFSDTKKVKEYGSKDLGGLTVEHGQEAFKEGKTVILTLKDKGILEEGEAEDVLMNVNMADDERHRESVENKKKKPAYNPYDDSQIDEFGMFKPRDVLDKYNDEIDGKKKEKFQLGSGGQYDAEHERQLKRFKEDVKQKGETLALPLPIVASEFYTEQEMAGFKKTKKKVRKIRKKPKVVTADDLIPLDGQEENDHGSRGTRRKRAHEDSSAAAIPGLDLVTMEVDDHPIQDEADISGPDQDLTGVAVEDDAMNDLQTALSKARKLKQRKRMDPEKKVLQHVREVGMEEGSDDETPSTGKLPGANIVLNSTSEFCRTLGDIPTYGQAGNREEDEEELLDFERELAEERRRKMEEEEMGATGWMSVEIDETPVDIAREEKGPLDEEPTLNSGLASALQLGLKKGYFEQEKIKSISAPKHKVLEAKNYSIEDKRYDDLDEKYNKRRDRFGSGVTMDFKELANYKPDIKIDYIDESGRNLNQKEAFRALSHRFHGKGSGKKKQEKRTKKQEQENLLMQASSTDTPLGTVAMLQEKQKQEKTPYIVLSGSNKGMTASTLTKS